MDIEQQAGGIKVIDQTAQIPGLLVPVQLSEEMKLIIVQLEAYEHIYDERSEIIELFKKYIADQKTNRALGCLFGCLIGDALGAFCEFMHAIQPQLLQQTMTMPGGGTFNLRIGQYTDDSQLAFHLLTALNTFNGEKSLKDQQPQLLKSIASEYLKWDGSGPFDVGITCSNGINVLWDHDKEIQSGKQINWEVIFKQILKRNFKSQSNGSLMRIEPMAIFLSMINQNPADHVEFIQNQIGLMHPNPVLKAAGTVWVNALSLAINRTGNSTQHFAKIWEEVQHLPQSELLHTNGWYGYQNQPKQSSMPGNVSMGWAKIAWTYGMRILRTLGMQDEKININDLGSDFYKNQIKWVISRAGDTDTNACIVGGLLGSVIGFTKLPAQYLNKIFKLRFPIESDKYTDRPFHYEPLNVLILALKFINKCQNYNHHN